MRCSFVATHLRHSGFGLEQAADVVDADALYVGRHQIAEFFAVDSCAEFTSVLIRAVTHTPNSCPKEIESDPILADVVCRLKISKRTGE